MRVNYVHKRYYHRRDERKFLSGNSLYIMCDLGPYQYIHFSINTIYEASHISVSCSYYYKFFFSSENVSLVWHIDRWCFFNATLKYDNRR